MIQKAYIILAHRAPQQLRRLVDALDDGNSAFFIHLDRKCEQEPFREALKGVREWRFVRSEDGGWGRVGIVKGTLHGLRAIADCGIEFDFVHLISGQDYPLRSNAYMDRFLSLNRDRIFIEHFEIPAPFWSLSNGGLDRICNYHVGDRRLGRWQKLSCLVTRVMNASVVFKRRFPRGLRPYGGWQWWSMPMHAVREILEFVRRRSEFLRFHRWSLLPDEMFFQTILLNSESDMIRRNLVNNALRFLDWDNPNPFAPATLTVDYFDALIQSRSLFARKFDPERDGAILDQLDDFRSAEQGQLMSRKLEHFGDADFTRSPDYPISPASTGTKNGLFRKEADRSISASGSAFDSEGGGLKAGAI